MIKFDTFIFTRITSELSVHVKFINALSQGINDQWTLQHRSDSSWLEPHARLVLLNYATISHIIRDSYQAD